MVKKDGVHSHIFLHAFRTAIIFISGFIIYEIFVEIEKKWNKKYPSRRIYNFSKRKFFKFLLILIIDMILLYMLYFIFKVEI